MKTWEDWKNTHQPFELAYHVNQGIAWCSDERRFDDFWSRIFEFIGAHGSCLDIGCGPRPPFDEGTAIDPLADEYRKLVPHWWEGVESYALPAEQFIPDLEGRFDCVMCWNCLDHTIGWKQILLNISRYGKENATYAIATDFKPPHVGHPGFERSEFFTEVAKHFEVVNFRDNFQERDIALVMT